MAKSNTFVTKLDREQGLKLGAALRDAGYEMRDADHAVFGAKGESVNVVYYESGKLVVQGKGLDSFREFRLGDLMLEVAPTLTARLIGADEAGKGDYFGPLVVAACALAPDEERFLDRAALTDSKLTGDRQSLELADQLKEILPHEVIVIGPKRYNELYASFGNLNRLLAWAHSKAILTLAERTGCRAVLLDRFCDDAVMMRAFGNRRDEIDFQSQTKAESNPAVGAASILARAAFLRGLARLKDVAGMTLPKGAGAPVLAAGKALIADKGPGILQEVAKIHFKTTGDLGA
jgi:ribonuclease HIII